MLTFINNIQNSFGMHNWSKITRYFVLKPLHTPCVQHKIFRAFLKWYNSPLVQFLYWNCLAPNGSCLWFQCNPQILPGNTCLQWDTPKLIFSAFLGLLEEWSRKFWQFITLSIFFKHRNQVTVSLTIMYDFPTKWVPFRRLFSWTVWLDHPI